MDSSSPYTKILTAQATLMQKSHFDQRKNGDAENTIDTGLKREYDYQGTSLKESKISLAIIS